MNTMDEIMTYFGRKLDADQQRAMESNDNTVVSAGAGSGKTTVLSFRFVRLLLENPEIHADNILALTFTDKAAKEMKSRISSHIRALAEAEDPIKQDTRARFADEWTNRFPQSQISTLDSFCSSIVRLDSLRYGLTKDFAVDEQRCRAQFSAIARDMLWNDPGRGRQLLAAFYQTDNLIGMLGKMAMEEGFLPDAMDPESYRDMVLEAIRQTKDARIPEIEEFYREMLGAEARNASEKIAKQICTDAWTAYVQHPDITILVDGLVRVKGKTVSSVGGGEVSAVKKAYRDTINKWTTTLSHLGTLQERGDDLLAVASFLAAYLKRCQDFKRQESILCYNDLIHLAIDILKHNVGIRRYYAKKFQKIMVDEFQDNNNLQKQLVFLLAAKDSYGGEEVPTADQLDPKLFFVGDEKQSIYRFRGADVSVFKQLGSELVSHGGASIEMATNYRSEKLLIDHFTTMFAKIMENPKKDYEATFQPLGSANDHPGHASIAVMAGRDDQDETANGDDTPAGRHAWEAKAIAEKIKKMLSPESKFLIRNTDPKTKASQPWVKPTANDIAILMHATSNQMLFEKALRSLDIPYAITQISRSLTLEAVANDLYSMLQLLVYPSDRLAYHAVLRSPFCRLDDNVVEQVMQSDVFDPGASDDPLFQQGCALYLHVLGMVSTQPLTRILDYLWYESGYRLSLLAYPTFQSYLSHYADLRQMAAEQEDSGKGIPEFLDYLRPMLGHSRNIKLSSSEGVIEEQQFGVKIMSIHASKGLEFPIVFVPDLAYDIKKIHTNANNPDFVSVQGHSIPCYAFDAENNDFVKDGLGFWLNEENKKQQVAEIKRLYYVAATRAEQYLVLSATYGKPPKDSKPDDTLFGWTLEALGIDKEALLAQTPGEERWRDDGICLESIRPIAESELHSQRKFSNVPKSNIKDWYTPEAFTPDLDQARIAVTDYCRPLKREQGAELLPVSPADSILGNDNDLITRWGTFVHARTMQMMGIYETDKTRDQLATKAFEKNKISAKDLHVLLDAGDELAQQFIQSAYYHREIEPYLQSTKAEVHLYFHPQQETNKELVVEGQIDILVKKPDGSYDILDFKTDKERNKNGHKQQVTLYKEALKQITHCDHIRTAIVYLRDPEHVVYWE